ncbi:MAG: flagellar basal body P-ring formation chaperone FlgA [Buchnera aphidicola (Nurudea shiraii)]
MILKIFMLFCLVFFVFFQVQANSFPEYLVKFLKEQQFSYFKNISIILYNNISYKNQISCFNPKFILIDRFRPSELINIKVICGNIHQFVQVKIEIRGEYLIASKNIKKGHKLTDTDISVKYGLLDKIPLNMYLKKKQALNLISSKNINKNELITLTLLHPKWLIEINQKVLVIIKNIGFIIILEGRAINNAYKNQQVKVKLKNGKIILGIVDNKGNVIIH